VGLLLLPKTDTVEELPVFDPSSAGLLAPSHLHTRAGYTRRASVKYFGEEAMADSSEA
jgi:hypothetical protein